ncbi:hypothetical protein [Gemmobacter sp. 24YEA27]|uniref:hypothetical protein n=1 Tax=Gemmobacter sp. 24YEA27 TaxID=3040672 RepID=UPI0024B3A4AC|nr:hypothetical protein [Gemmobacter sp. 24YEA27]
MIPRISYAREVRRFLFWRRFWQAMDHLTTIAIVVFLAILVVISARMMLTTLLSLTFTGTPPGCC